MADYLLRLMCHKMKFKGSIQWVRANTSAKLETLIASKQEADNLAGKGW